MSVFVDFTSELANFKSDMYDFWSDFYILWAIRRSTSDWPLFMSESEFNMSNFDFYERYFMNIERLNAFFEQIFNRKITLYLIKRLINTKNYSLIDYPQRKQLIFIIPQ